LLPAPRRWVVDAELGRVDVDHSPDDRPRKDLAERLRRIEAVARRERDPLGRELLRPEFCDRPFSEDADGLSNSQRSFSIVTGSTSCCARYTSTNSPSVSDLETRRSGRSLSSSRSNASAASCAEPNPPRCARFEPRPPSRYRYAHSGRPSRPARFSRNS
jgi:hypothetical protein